MPRRRGGQRQSGEGDTENQARSSGGSLAVDRIVGRSEQYHEDGLKLRASLQDFGKILGSISYLDADKREEMSKQLLEAMKTSLKTKKEIDLFVHSVAAIKPQVTQNSLEDVTNASEMPNFDEKLSSQMETLRKTENLENDLEYKKLIKALKLNKDDDDEDVEIDETQQVSEAQLRDPITQTLFQEPLKSNKCGHVYSKASVQSYFKTSKKCAYAGCHHTLSKNDFSRDLETEVSLRKLDRLTQRQATQNDNNDAMEIDDDDDDDDE